MYILKENRRRKTKQQHNITVLLPYMSLTRMLVMQLAIHDTLHI